MPFQTADAPAGTNLFTALLWVILNDFAEEACPGKEAAYAEMLTNLAGWAFFAVCRDERTCKATLGLLEDMPHYGFGDEVIAFVRNAFELVFNDPGKYAALTEEFFATSYEEIPDWVLRCHPQWNAQYGPVPVDPAAAAAAAAASDSDDSDTNYTGSTATNGQGNGSTPARSTSSNGSGSTCVTTTSCQSDIMVHALKTMKLERKEKDEREAAPKKKDRKAKNDLPPFNKEQIPTEEQLDAGYIAVVWKKTNNQHYSVVPDSLIENFLKKGNGCCLLEGIYSPEGGGKPATFAVTNVDTKKSLLKSLFFEAMVQMPVENPVDGDGSGMAQDTV